MKQLKNTEWFIEKANLKHNFKYDYSNVVYEGSRKTLTITCKVHGNFKQIAYYHLAGNGCPSCSANVKSSTCDFNKKVCEIFGDTLDTTAVIYSNSKTPVELTCTLHKHTFFQAPYQVLAGKVGCKECLGIVYDTDSFIRKAKDVHGGFYDYSDVNYQKSSEKVAIKCPLHGLFYQTPNKHLSGGCVTCGKTKRAASKTYTSNKFIEKANKVYNNFYDYSETVYVNSRSKVKIRCPLHGPFEQIAANHLRSVGCQACVSITCRSKVEKFLADLCLQSKTDTVFSYRPHWLAGKELDVYIPSLSLAIEYNGIAYHHSSLGVSNFLDSTYKEPAYHKLKVDLCKQNGITLIHIFEFEDIEEWADLLANLLKEPSKYRITFKNNKRTYKKLVFYGSTKIEKVLL